MKEEQDMIDTETVSEEDKKHQRILIFAIAVVVILAIAMLVYLFWPKPSVPVGGDFYDQDAQTIQQAINHEVEDGYFNMTINSSVPVYEGTNAMAGIQNIESNHFDCKVTVTLEDGTVVYESGGLAPGQQLEYITLSEPLATGSHQATALFEIYEADDSHTKAGQTASKIQLIAQ